jgi:hypothetical protein
MHLPAFLALTRYNSWLPLQGQNSEPWLIQAPPIHSSMTWWYTAWDWTSCCSRAFLSKSPIGNAFRATTLSVQGETFSMDCYTLHLEGFDIILGVQWLQSLRPIIWDFNALSMAFGREGCSIRFIGCEGTPCTLYSVQPIDNILEALFIAYSDIFEEPLGLPPQHHRDHRIHLLLGTTPVVVRPYRYSQLLKDEVERQCTDKLAQGIIRPSTSPFSSPVLLVKKSDGMMRTSLLWIQTIILH